MFVEEAGVFEVEVDSADDKKKRVRCTCPAFQHSTRCKHAKFVREVMDENDGHYTVQVLVDTPDEAAIEAMESAEAFREFIIKHAKVETLP